MKLAKHQIAHQFSRAAPTYEQVAGLQIQMADRLLQSIPVSAQGTLVDFGCGPGWALGQLERTNRFQLIGIDIAPGMIEIASQRVPSASFHCCDFETTPLQDHSVDVVFSNAALQWCDAGIAIEEINRVCKSGGSVHLSTFGPKTLGEIRSAWQSVDDDSPRVHEFESAEALMHRFEENGFQNISMQKTDAVQKFDGLDGLLQSIKELGATNASTTRQTGLLGTKRYRQFRNVLEDRLRKHGQLELTFECIYIFAEKLSHESSG